MDLFLAAVISALFLYAVFRWIHASRSARLEAALVAVEAATPAVMADWPDEVRYELNGVISWERTSGTYDFHRGIHHGRSREDHQQWLARVNAAELRIAEATRIATHSETRPA